MDISFDNKKLEKEANEFKLLQRRYGQIGAKLIKRRLDDLRAAKTLEDVRGLPGKYHELKENRKGQLAVHIHEPNRLIFVPDHIPLPIIGNGILDWKEITSIKIIEIIDYHGE